MIEIRYRPIGIIRSPFTERRGTPIQPAGAQNIAGTVEIFPEYVAGLKDLQGFSHIFLIYHFHLSEGHALEIKPYMDDQLRGVFATRAPARPNAIGLSLVHLVKVKKDKLHIRNVDIVDGTPLLDIKPYVSAFNSVENEKIGWLEDEVNKVYAAKDEGQFQTT